MQAQACIREYQNHVRNAKKNIFDFKNYRQKNERRMKKSEEFLSPFA